LNRAATLKINGNAVATDVFNDFETNLTPAPLPALETSFSLQAVASDGAITKNNYVVENARTLTYDPDGNLIGDGVNTYSWDQESRLTGISNGVTFTSLTYDGWSLAVRIMESVSGSMVSDKRYVWDGLDIVEERDSSGSLVLKRYFDDGMQLLSGQAAGVYYYSTDHLGSIRTLTDASGTIRASYDYDLYGKQTKTGGDLDADFGFAGLFSTKVGLLLAPYRAYSPNIGRWINRDPIEEEGGLNLYAYVGSNPINFTDVLGLKPGDKYPTTDAAAIQASDDINGKSIKEGKEYAGRIYKNSDGTYSYTPPNKGGTDYSFPGNVPPGTKNAGYYHTHGSDDPRYDNENFSPADKDIADREGKPGYVATPKHAIKKYIPKKGKPGKGRTVRVKKDMQGGCK
jgi:RHS repeat-associated protein